MCVIQGAIAFFYFAVHSKYNINGTPKIMFIGLSYAYVHFNMDTGEIRIGKGRLFV